MDQTLVASIRKDLEAKSTAELGQAYESSDRATKAPEELEAMRQLLDERRTKGNRVALALAAAILMGTLGAACTWWQGASEGMVLLAGVGGAILGFASCYIPGLFGQAWSPPNQEATSNRGH